MKTSIVIGLIIASMIAIGILFHFVHPVLILTIGDVMTMILVDVIISFCLALYLGFEKGKNTVALWTILGSACLLIPIIAALMKYNVGQRKQKQ
jgi:hypothetical protein